MSTRLKGRALRRALSTSNDSVRVSGDVPLLTDTTELITADIAHAMLQRNKNNRPINWNKVEEYAALMAAGKWELHSQGIILDTDNNILTGQKRLWAVIYSNTSVLMRVSRGNPARVATLLDRGTPQTARDLAARESGRRHSPTEASLARAILALQGNTRPTLAQYAAALSILLEKTKGTKKAKSVLMIIAVLCVNQNTALTPYIETLAGTLTAALAPQSVERCWGKGVAFGLAMNTAKSIVEGWKK